MSNPKTYEKKGLSWIMKHNYKNGEGFSEDLKTKPYFYHYTSRESAKAILNKDGDKYFFLNPLSATNDREEVEHHTNDKDKVFVLCFSHSDAEKEDIPLWYLYGGLTGNGVKIGFTSAKMKKIISEIDEIYPVENNTIDFGRPYHRETDFELECGWVFYFKDSGEFKYRGKEYQYADICLNELYEKSYLIKNFAWRGDWSKSKLCAGT